MFQKLIKVCYNKLKMVIKMILAINIGIFIFLIILGGLMLVGALVTLVVVTIIYKKDKEGENATFEESLDDIYAEQKMSGILSQMHSITFNAMGVLDNPKTLYGVAKIPDDLPMLRAEGFIFLGWSLSFESMIPPILGAELDRDVTLFAMWQMIANADEDLDEKDFEINGDNPDNDHSLNDEELTDDELNLNEEIDDLLDEDDTEDDEKEVEEAPSEVLYDEKKHEYFVVRYKRTYEGRMCNLPLDVLRYYNIVKNKLLSYENVLCNETKDIEKFRNNRKLVAQLKPSGKSISLYLALDINNLENKYKARDVKMKKAYVSTPVLVKAKSDRKCKYMLDLIEKMMNELGIPFVKESKINFSKKYTNISEEQQISLGWLIKKTEKVEGEILTLKNAEDVSQNEVKNIEHDEVAISNSKNDDSSMTTDDVDFEDIEINEEVVNNNDEIVNTLNEERYKKLSEIGINRAKEFRFKENPNGIVVVGTVFNQKSKIVFYKASEFNLNIGDIVLVRNKKNKLKAAVVVVKNQKISEYKLEKPIRNVEKVFYSSIKL